MYLIKRTVSLFSLFSCMYLYIKCSKRGTPKNLFTYKTLCRFPMKQKCTGKLKMKRIGFSDKRSD